MLGFLSGVATGAIISHSLKDDSGVYCNRKVYRDDGTEVPVYLVELGSAPVKDGDHVTVGCEVWGGRVIRERKIICKSFVKGQDGHYYAKEE